MKTVKVLGASMLALSAALAAPAAAQSTTGYVQGAGAIVKNPFGLCWRAGYWTPAMAIMECDPDLVPKPAAPAPAPARVVPPPPPRAAPVPAPALVPAPAPAAPKAAAASPAPKRCDAAVSLSADETFEFNKAALKPAATAKLDKDVLAKLAQCAKVNLVLVSGYTDRLGSQQYNQKLSEKRAEAVKSYLVKKGVNAGVIETMGMGKTLQIKACPDGKDRKALIACLAPNRRVVVEIKGPAK